MKILSQQEFGFLLNPNDFSDGYKRVLKSRIIKKKGDMELVLNFINERQTSLMTKKELRKYKFKERYHLWLDTLTEAFTMLKEDKSKWKRYWETRMEEVQKEEAKLIKEERFDEIDKLNGELNREVVTKYMSKGWARIGKDFNHLRSRNEDEFIEKCWVKVTN